MDDLEFQALLADVAAEAAELVEVLAGLSTEDWRAPTPAEGWDIHDQVVHLAYFDDIAMLGFTDPQKFRATADVLVTTGEDWVDQISHDRSMLHPAATLRWFTESRASLVNLFEGIDPSARTPWFGPDMSAASSVTARLMETWAHGQDVYDTFGLERKPTDRVRHICHLGVITRAFSFRLRGLAAPEDAVRVELTGPSGDLWTWGPEDAAARVGGTALDFALVVTQRRHRADTGLTYTPGVAEEWLSVAQAFAGAPGPGRQPGQFQGGGG